MFLRPRVPSQPAPRPPMRDLLQPVVDTPSTSTQPTVSTLVDKVQMVCITEFALSILAIVPISPLPNEMVTGVSINGLDDSSCGLDLDWFIWSWYARQNWSCEQQPIGIEKRASASLPLHTAQIAKLITAATAVKTRQWESVKYGNERAPIPSNHLPHMKAANSQLDHVIAVITSLPLFRSCQIHQHLDTGVIRA